MKKLDVRSLVFLAILAAWGIVLRQFDFPILPAAPFLKVDLSDLTALIALIVHGPVGLVIVALIRDSLNYVLKGGEVGIPIGAIMSFVATLAMFLPAHIALKYMKQGHKWFKYAFMSIGLILLLTVSMALINYYVALPLYIKVLNFPIDNILAYVMTLIVPFNLIKGLILAGLQVITLRTVMPFIQKRDLLFGDYQRHSQKRSAKKLAVQP